MDHHPWAGQAAPGHGRRVLMGFLCLWVRHRGQPEPCPAWCLSRLSLPGSFRKSPTGFCAGGCWDKTTGHIHYRYVLLTAAPSGSLMLTASLMCMCTYRQRAGPGLLHCCSLLRQWVRQDTFQPFGVQGLWLGCRTGLIMGLLSPGMTTK